MTSVLPQSPGYFVGTSVAELGRRLRAGQVTSVELTQAALDSIARLNPLLNAFVHVNTQGALAQAAHADAELKAGRDAGPLHGIAVAIKDNIDTFDMPTTYGSAHFANHVPRQDAQCVQRLREGGAVILGKTLTHEFAYGPTGDRSLQGASCNPWDLSRMTGGSSAGSAAAVAAGLVPVALGTDTGGSIRIPAGLCGAVGFKPSLNAVAMEGIFPLCKTLDHVGPIANTVEDAALVFSVISGQPRQPIKASARRVGWIDVQSLTALDPQVGEAAKAYAQTLFGTELETLEDFATTFAQLRQALPAIQRSEAYEVHHQRVAQAPQLFEKEVLERLHMSAEIRGWEYIQGMKTRDELIRKMAACFEQFDLLVMPTLPITAPLIDQREVDLGGDQVSVREAVLSLTSAWNLTGLPAISIPAGFVGGLPVGLQVIAASGQDAYLLNQLQRV